MTTLQVVLALAVIALFIVQYLHFSYKLKAVRKEKDDYAKDSFNARENYRIVIEEKDKDIKYFKSKVKEEEDKTKSWKDSSDLKQIALDNAYIKIDTFVNLVKYLNNNWYKHLIVKESDQPTWPSIRLSTKDYTKGYEVKSYQGSRNLENNIDFALQMREGVYTYLDHIISDISNTHNPIDSDRFQLINNFLKQTNE